MELRRRVHSSPLMLAFQPLFRNCQAELKIWLQFAGEIGALSKAEEKELQRRICVALKQVGLDQKSISPGGRSSIAVCDTAPMGAGQWWRSRGRSAWKGTGSTGAMGLAS